MGQATFRRGSVAPGCVLILVLAVCAVVGMAIFGMGAVQRMEDVREAAQLTGVAPETSAPPLLEQVWSVAVDQPFSSFNLIGDPEAPEEILLVTELGDVLRISPDGRLLKRYTLPRKAYAAQTDPAGRWRGFVAKSAITKRQVWWRISIRDDLSVWNLDGQELELVSFDPEETGVFGLRLGDVDGDQAPEVVAFLDQHIRVLELDGREIGRLPGPIYNQDTYGVIDVDGDGVDEILAKGATNTVLARSMSGETVGEWALSPSDNELRPARLTPRGKPSFVALGSSLIEGQTYRAKASFIDASGAKTGEALLPENVRLTYRDQHVAAADLDRNGVREWAFASQDGALHFLEPEGSLIGSHYTGMRIDGLLTLPGPNGDLLLTATHRSVVAWRRTAGR